MVYRDSEEGVLPCDVWASIEERPTSGRLACNGTVHRVGECEVK